MLGPRAPRTEDRGDRRCVPNREVVRARADDVSVFFVELLHTDMRQTGTGRKGPVHPGDTSKQRAWALCERVKWRDPIENDRGREGEEVEDKCWHEGEWYPKAQDERRRKDQREHARNRIWFTAVDHGVRELPRQDVRGEDSQVQQMNAPLQLARKRHTDDLPEQPSRVGGSLRYAGRRGCAVVQLYTAKHVGAVRPEGDESGDADRVQAMAVRVAAMRNRGWTRFMRGAVLCANERSRRSSL
jgi:hypothetical protein